MKIFISWSGQLSRSIAATLRTWLPGLLQAADIWMSDSEIESGQRWNEEVSRALDASDFGIICLTRANQHAPWLMFESGALAKKLAASQIVPIYINIEPAEVTGPLAAWQGRRLDYDGLLRVTTDINSMLEKSVPSEILQRLFQLTWPDVEASLVKATSQEPKSHAAARTTEDMLSELVERVRRIDDRRLLDRIDLGPTAITFSGDDDDFV